MTPKIIQVSEAFSMQPSAYYVCKDKENFYDKDFAIKEFIERTEHGEPCVFAYNYEGKQIHRWILKSVNLTFEP